jgi:[acyl-carrier-protein] S-malonyltransferase
MGHGLVRVRELLDQVRDLDIPDDVGKGPWAMRLEQLCLGPEPRWDEADLQPALFLTCLAAGETLASEIGLPDAITGHSLGEYAALVLARALSFEVALRLVICRGRIMARAAAEARGAMVAVVGLDPETVAAICDRVRSRHGRGAQLWVSARNSPIQTVLSGRCGELDTATEECVAAGAAKVARLDVPIPGHCPLMGDAADELRAELDRLPISPPQVAFYSSVDGAAHDDPREIRDLLAASLTRPVQFVTVLRKLADHDAPTFVEVGPSRVLSGLVRDTVTRARSHLVSDDEDVRRLATSLARPDPRLALDRS